MVTFDYSKLRGRITEKYGSQGLFAQALGCSERTISLKMNNLRAWTQRDIVKASELLDIHEDEIQDYFFKQKVQNF